MKLATARYFFITFFFSILIAFGQSPYDLVKLEKPPQQRLVQDYAQIFSERQLNDLENKLVAYDDSTSTQILVLTVKSLDGYPLETFANEIGEKWGVGTKGKDNGVVIVLSEKDRKITIRTGYSAQIYLPPSVNKSIIENVIVPYFRQGDYAGGIDAGVDNIFKAFAGKYKNEKSNKPKSNVDALVLFFVIAFFIFIFYIVSRGSGGSGGSNGGNGGRRRGILEDIIIMNTGSSIFGSGGFGSGSSSGGGGFGGFGGGSFGGGGASGSW